MALHDPTPTSSSWSGISQRPRVCRNTLTNTSRHIELLPGPWSPEVFHTELCPSCFSLEHSTPCPVQLVNIYLYFQFKYFFSGKPSWAPKLRYQSLLLALLVSSSVIAPVTTEQHLFVDMSVSPPEDHVPGKQDHLHLTCHCSFKPDIYYALKCLIENLGWDCLRPSSPLFSLFQ